MLNSDVTIRTINNESYTFSLSSSTPVVELKRLLKESTSISEERQRLIYRGRVLQDSSTLIDYSIGTGHVLHMVARPENFTELLRGASQTTPSTAAEGRTNGAESSLQNLLGSLFGGTSSVNQQQAPASTFTLPNSRQIGLPAGIPAAAVSSSREGVSQQVAPSDANNARSAEIANAEAVERIRQGFLTMFTLMSTMESIPALSGQHAERDRDFDPPLSSSQSGSLDQNSLVNRPFGTSDSVDSLLPHNFSAISDIDASAGASQIAEPRSESGAPAGQAGLDTNPLAGTVTRTAMTRQFFVGQWVDVKDTVNQWLEATIMEVDQDQRRVFVHYNGW
jgi:uncharacterized ubiquitin-like protein YukD